MRLDRVTMTGADDSVDPNHLAELSAEFPFVEWGILLSASSCGRPRFPSSDWIIRLRQSCLSSPRMVVSLHVCGRWVREICDGNWMPIMTDVGQLFGMANRVQLNFHSYQHLLAPEFLGSARGQRKENGWTIIFQCDGVNDALVSMARDADLDAVPLYDKSGGAGVVPDSWPKAMKGIYSGYAGGLGPDNLEAELQAIAEAAGEERFWIDMETKIRTPDNRTFDLDAVRQCLDICRPFITQEPRQDAE